MKHMKAYIIEPTSVHNVTEANVGKSSIEHVQWPAPPHRSAGAGAAWSPVRGGPCQRTPAQSH